MYLRLHVKCPLFLSDIKESLSFSEYFQKIIECQIPWKSVQWEQSWAHRRTDMTKLIVAFRNFAKSA